MLLLLILPILFYKVETVLQYTGLQLQIRDFDFPS